MKKWGVILASVAMAFIIISSGVVIYLSSTDARKMAYIRLSVNPQIEFVCEGQKVVSFFATNEESKELCAGEEFEGLDVLDATHKFVDLCTRAGYIDFDNMDNAVGIACVAGISQVLETMVYKTVSDYLKQNQILGAVLESSNDNKTVKDAKKMGVTTDKFTLVNAYMQFRPEADVTVVKHYTVPKLISGIKDSHKQFGSPTTNFSEEDLISKNMLLEINREKYARHQQAITPETQRDFKSIYIANQKELKQKIRDDFNSAYELWKVNHVNFVV